MWSHPADSVTLPADCALALSIRAAAQMQAAMATELIARLSFLMSLLLSLCLEIFLN